MRRQPRTTPTGDGHARREHRTPASDGQKRKPTTLDNIQKLEKEREARRQAIIDRRADKAAEEKRNQEAGIVGDADFIKMIAAFRESTRDQVEARRLNRDMKVCICVRKRPINAKEIKKQDHDSVTCLNPRIVVHDCKHRVDGITKYLDNQGFAFDHSFSEDSTTEELYFFTAKPLVSYVADGGRATCFAYGQTGSGKTFTMMGIQEMAVRDLFAEIEHDSDLEVCVSFFEIYGGRCQDLLNNRSRLNVREDGRGEVHVGGLEEFVVPDAEELLALVERGNRQRTTQKTEANDTSSRSHAICQVALRRARTGRLHGKLSLVDLAGSERGNDTKSHNRQLRTESADINKSLLALKECIRGIASNSSHVPFRASKLTMVLRDSFVRPNSRVAMIATVSPAMSSADHTINTLRYADRVKEKDVHQHRHMDEASHSQYTDQQMFDDWSRGRGGGGGGGGSGVVEAKLSPPLPPPQHAPHSEHAYPKATPDVDTPAQDHRRYSDPRHAQRTLFGANKENRFADERDTPVSGRVGDGGSDAGTPATMAAATTPTSDNHDADLQYLQESLGNPSADLVELHKTVDNLFEEEESLLNMHMNVIQENAELLTEEGRLLQQIQGDQVVDYDIDMYAARLQEILDRKTELITMLQSKLTNFRHQLQEEEYASQRVNGRLPQY